jgi:uncharacterized protein YbcC (UPF0753/DUF2309 family)
MGSRLFRCGSGALAAPRGQGAYAAWRAAATHDLTPEIIGLADFATFVSQTPEAGPDALRRATEQLGLSADGLDSYSHQLLLSPGGWAQYARYRHWQAERTAQTDGTIAELLTIRLQWEAAPLARYGEPLARQWETARAVHQREILLCQVCGYREERSLCGISAADPGPCLHCNP